MKKTLSIVTLIIILSLSYYFWISRYGPAAQQAFTNVENSKKLKVGMRTKSALKIMGEPKSIEYRSEWKDSVLFYQPPFASSAGIHLVIQNDTLRQIIYFEGS